jgi:hypothetical protein
MAEPALTEIFGAGATQTATTITISKSELELDANTTTHGAEQIVAALVKKLLATATPTMRESNPDRSIAVETDLGQLVSIIQGSNVVQLYEHALKVTLRKPDQNATITPSDY